MTDTKKEEVKKEPKACSFCSKPCGNEWCCMNNQDEEKSC